MERIEDIEEFYKKENERADKEFLDNLSKLKKSEEKSNLIETFRKKSKKIRDNYEKDFTKYLTQQKNILKNKKKVTIKEEETKTLDIKRLSLESSWKEKINYKWQISKFIYKIKIKNFFSKITPDKMKIGFLKIKFLFYNIKSKINSLVLDFLNNLKKQISFLIAKIRYIFLNLLQKLSSLFNILINFIKKIIPHKRIIENTTKRPDEEIAERLLKNAKN